MVNIKSNKKLNRTTPYEYSIKSWKKWADKNNCELFILEDWVYDESIINPNWHKLLVFDLLENNEIDYNQILVVDSDTIPHPNCPNFFDMSENKLCGVHNDGSYDWVCRSIENYSKHIFDGFTFPLWEYINSGFLIINKNHKKLYQNIMKFYLENNENIRILQESFGVGTDQPIINFFIQKEKIDMKLLSYKFNMQDMFRKEILTDDLLFTKLGWVYHFNAIPNNVDSQLTIHWMKKTYEYFYGNK